MKRAQKKSKRYLKRRKRELEGQIKYDVFDPVLSLKLDEVIQLLDQMDGEAR